MKKNILLLAAMLCLVANLWSQECQPDNQCETAVLICGYAMEHQVFNNNVPFSDLNIANCTIDPHNPVWFRVIACDSEIELNIHTLSTINGDGLQAALLESCDATLAIGCNSGNPFGAGAPLFLSAPVTPGESYWLVIDGYEGDICDFTFDILQGIDTLMPVPSTGDPFPGTITGQSFGVCQTSAGQYVANWPGCSTWNGGGFVCKDEDCICTEWTLPPGAFIVGDPCSNEVWIDFSATPPGDYILKAEPVCLCNDNLCESCGPICCPVEPATLPISIVGPQTILLPDIFVCTVDDFPACVYEPGNFATSSLGVCFTSDPATCSILRQNYRVTPPIVTNLGVLPLCGTAWICGVPYTQPGVYVEVCTTPSGCDSTIFFNLVIDPACVFDCTGLNTPAPPGDSCHLAPFFCGNYLESYCGSNVGLQDDSLQNGLFENAGFIGFSPCSDSVVFQVSVNNCTPGSTGLQFEVYEGECLSGPSLGAITVNNQDVFNWSLSGYQPDSVYTLVVSGINNSECDFTLEALGGIGTGTPDPDTCVCTDGYIEGPDQICPGQVYEYTLVLPVCTSIPGGISGGNGLFCAPPGICPTSQGDSLVLEWNIPAGTHFVGDSTGTNIFLEADSSYFDLDTIRMDSVYVNWSFINTSPPVIDTLLFCDCAGSLGCFGTIAPKQVTLFHNVDQFQCTLTCAEPVCVVNGVAYSAPGTYVVDVDNCNRNIIIIDANFQVPANPLVSDQTICLGESATLVIEDYFPPFQYNWSNNDFGQIITVSPTTTTTYTVFVTNPSSGCVSSSQVTVTVLSQVSITQLPPAFLCPGESIQVCGTPYSAPGVYTEVCTSWLGCDSIINFSILSEPINFVVNTSANPVCVGQTVTLSCVPIGPSSGWTYAWRDLSTGMLYSGASISVAPASTTTFELTVTNASGCTQTALEQITITPYTEMQAGVVGAVTCNQPCFSYNGKSYCAPGTYSDTLNCIVTIFDIEFAKETIQDGVVGTLNCINTCLVYLEQTICNAGTYTVEDSCYIHVFEVQSDQTPPTANAEADINPLCIGQTANLSANSDGSNDLYQWQDLSTGSIYSGQSIQVTPNQTTTYELTVTNPDNGCTQTTQMIVTVNQLTEVSLGIVGQVSCDVPCFDYNGSSYCLPGTYRDTANCVISVFELIFARDTLQEGVVGTLTCEDTCITYLGQSFCAPGNYTVEDSCYVHRFQITEDLGVPEISGLAHNCLPNNTQFTVSFNISGQAPYKVNGSNLSGDYYLSQPIASNSSYLFVVKQNNGCETVVSGLYDCSASCVTDAGQLSTALIQVCAGQQSVQAVSTADPMLAPGDVVVFQLQSADGTILDQNTSGQFNYIPGILEPGQTYQVLRVAGPADADGAPQADHPCTDVSNAQSIVFQSVPQIDSVLSSSPVCAGESNAWLEVFASDASSNQLLYALDGQAFGPLAFLENVPAGVYHVAVQNDAGCMVEQEITIPEAVDIELEIGPDQTINFGQSVSILANTTKPPASIQWSASNGWTESDSVRWLLRPLESILVQCEVIDSNGCKDTDQANIFVELQSGIYRPNVIKPEGSLSENRYFTIYAAEGWISNILSLSIYNRWGEMVFQNTNFDANIPEQGWDGAYNGRKSLPGVYVYRVEVMLADGSRQVFEDELTLIR